MFADAAYDMIEGDLLRLSRLILPVGAVVRNTPNPLNTKEFWLCHTQRVRANFAIEKDTCQ